MDNQHLVNLCSRAWAIDALALMASGVSGRVSPLSAAANCGRTSMTASVEHLLLMGFLEKNPGYGHPLRPEYRMTAKGEQFSEWALELRSMIKKDHDRALLRAKWSLPLINCLPEYTQYSELRRQLAPVTDRALSNCLARLNQNSWVNRSVSKHYSPPIVSYGAIKIGQKVHQHLQLLP